MEKLLQISSFKLWGLLFGILLLRYIVIAGVPYLWLYVIKREKYIAQKLQNRIPDKEQIRNEVKYSLFTLFIYSSGIWLFLYWLREDYTRSYIDIQDFGWPYLLLSVGLMVLLHDTYFYWTHRLIHHKLFFKRVHLLHHKFVNPSPWCAFALHPIEAVLSLGIIPLIIFLIPWHFSALVMFATIVVVQDTFVHLGFDLKGLKLFKWQNSPEDHDLHHRDARYNFGLYFTFWDRIMGTYLKSRKTMKNQFHIGK